MALAGIALGLTAALALTRVLSSLLYGVGATDPLTFAGVSLLLIICGAAGLLPSGAEGNKVDPLVAPSD